MSSAVIFDPLVPWIVIWALLAAGLFVAGYAAWRGLSGWALRGLAALAMGAALANPSLQREEREPLSDIVIAIVDQSASQRIAGRVDQTEAAFANLAATISARQNTELRRINLGDGEANSGTRLVQAVNEAVANEPRGRIAGIVLLSDGRAHDSDHSQPLPAPMHLLLSGQARDWDRRLIIRNAPAFSIIGEETRMILRIEDQGAGPSDLTVPLTISVDGGAPLQFEIPLGQDMEVPVTLPHGGMNVLQFETPVTEGELTEKNNAAVVQINGVRDRLRVLLVSGEPYPGERTWRNLLKADAAVDLVHFTILRPPEKQDGIPVDELALIAFPTRELFLEKINDFDLIVFDRYSRRGILANAYFDSIRDYVIGGGAVLIAAGPEYGSAESIYRSSLGPILPGAPTARVVEQGFRPEVTELGRRHPVTEAVSGFAAADENGQPSWGRWFRMVDVLPAPDSDVVMSGPDARPLLMLNRVGEGRVALLASDQAWLWDRGFEGGGPQLELLRRLAHWMMKEPELEEEALWVEPTGQTMRIIRRSLTDDVGDVTIQQPDGTAVETQLTQISPGRFETQWLAPETGLYRLTEGDETAVIALGPAAPREFEETLASGDPLAPLLSGTNGGTLRMEDGAPSLRAVRAGRPALGRDWIGITPRNAYRTANVRVFPLFPAWLALLVIATLILGAWLLEGRK